MVGWVILATDFNSKRLPMAVMEQLMGFGAGFNRGVGRVRRVL